MPSVFVSYSRPRSLWVAELCKDLEHGLGDGIEVHVDPSTYDAMADVAPQATGAAESASVLLCLCDATFASQDLARREVDCFSRAGGQASHVVNLCWDPLANSSIAPGTPPFWEPTQHTQRYRKRGGQTLLKRRTDSDSPWRTILDELVERIRELLRSANKVAPLAPPPPTLGTTLERKLVVWFSLICASRAELQPVLGVFGSIVADLARYGPTPRDWKPYVPDRERHIVPVLQEIAGSRGLRGAFIEDADPRALVREAREAAIPLLLVVDPWSLAVERTARLLGAWRDALEAEEMTEAILFPSGTGGAAFDQDLEARLGPSSVRPIRSLARSASLEALRDRTLLLILDIQASCRSSARTHRRLPRASQFARLPSFGVGG